MTTTTAPERPLPVWLDRLTFLRSGAQSRGMTLRQHLDTPAAPWPASSSVRPLSGRAALRRLYADIQAAYVESSSSWRLGVPPVKLADLEPAEELRDTSTTEVERLEITPHKPVDTGALPPVPLPRAPQPKHTDNRVCSAMRTRGPLEEVHHR